MSIKDLFGTRKTYVADDIKGLTLETYFERLRTAHSWVSHTPEKRAYQRVINDSALFDADVEKILDAGGDVELFKERWLKKYEAWISAKGNCASSMITGPARFPVAKQRKKHDREMVLRTELVTYCDYVLKIIAKKKRYEARKDIDPIAEALANYESEKRNLEKMKAANVILRKKKLERAAKITALEELGFTKPESIFKPDFAGRIGFPSYMLTNCRQRMKRWNLKHKTLLKASQTESTELEKNGVRIVINQQAGRIQVILPGKPPREIINLFKTPVRFNWSRRNGAWQGYINDRVLNRAKEILDLIPEGTIYS